MQWKHPRGDGEEMITAADGKETLETPPWGRGRNLYRSRIAPGLGNTPVGTGKNCRLLLQDPEWQKHPRGDGEEQPIREFGKEYTETPPWGRGRSNGNSVNFGKTRNTPVGTGKNAIFCMWYSLI